MFVPTKAIVLRSIRYSEADLIAKCYTASDGLKSYMLRGVLKTRRGKLKAAMFQPFSQLEIMARHKNKGRLESIKEAKITAINPNIRSNVQKSSIAIFLAEVIQNAIQEEEKNESLFNFLEESIQALETTEKFANFHLYFLVAFTKHLGFFPHGTDQNEEFFNLQEGYFEAEESNNRYSIGGKNSTLLKTLMNCNLENYATIKLKQDSRQNFLAFMITYYQIQLQGFRQPQSIEVLNQLFT